MGNENLSYKFSNEVYATRSEVSQYLGMSNIDVIWSGIVNYRSNYTLSLGIRNIERMPLNLVLSPRILDRLTYLERRLAKLMVKYARLKDDDYERYSIRNNQLIDILKSVAQKYGIEFTDGLANVIISGNPSALTPNQNILLNYYQALVQIETHFYDPIDEKFLRNILTILNANRVNENLYRVEEIEDRSSRFVIDRMYAAAPVERIEPMMSELLAFLNETNLSSLAKAIVAYFYVNIVKPFDCFSEEISVLLLKMVLAHSDFDEISILLNFECLIAEYQEDINFVIKEVNRTNDVTYLLVKVLDIMEERIDNLFKSLSNINATSIEKEFFKNEEPEEKSVKKQVEVVEKEENLLHNVDYEVRVALPKLPIGLDEKDASRIAEHLLEMNPNLKRGEAMFYARHCTIGKYYTISQYKEMLDCAYETARTSMDHLAAEGFYRKEMVKNKKYVYTPIPRK